MKALGSRFLVAVVAGIAVVSGLSVLASDAPDGFEASAMDAGHDPADNPGSAAPESDGSAAVLIPLGLAITGAGAIAATRLVRSDARETAADES